MQIPPEYINTLKNKTRQNHHPSPKTDCLISGGGLKAVC